MLYLVATPIGHLGDVSLRALEVLRAADVIACEDTRHSATLLRRYEIDKPLIAFHEHNEDASARGILNLLAQGKTVAVVSDAGTPGISDPGFTLVRACIEAGQQFTVIPGPSAFVMALVMSGLPSHSFTFRGFAPRKSGQRQTFLRVDAESPHTLIYYESPFRVKELLQDALTVFGDRRAALANDLTKMFERVDRGSLSELLALVEKTEPKGEYVLVVEGAEKRKRNKYPNDSPDSEIESINKS